MFCRSSWLLYGIISLFSGISALQAEIYLVTPTEISFQLDPDAGFPGDQILTIRNSGSGTAHWTLAENADWLSISSTTGTATEETPGEVTLHVNSAGLTSGIYTCDLHVEDSQAAASPQVIPVTLTAVLPQIKASANSIRFYTRQGAGNPAPQTFEIWNSSDHKLQWHLDYSCPWLSAVPDSGSSTGEKTSVTLQVDSSGLTEEVHTCQLLIRDPFASNSPYAIPVTLTFNTHQIGISQREFVFLAQQNGANPNEKIMEIWNAGDGVLSWQATEACSWLSLSATNGISGGPAEVYPVSLSVNPAGLSAGTHTCSVMIFDTMPGLPSETAQITFHVFPADGTIEVPEDYPTIQEAIDAAFEGDGIVVSSGTYLENINFQGKNITLTSANPSDWSVVETTIIQGDGTTAVVKFAGTETSACELKGFTITGGNQNFAGGGIDGNYLSPTHAAIRRCIDRNNRADWCGGIA